MNFELLNGIPTTSGFGTQNYIMNAGDVLTDNNGNIVYTAPFGNINAGNIISSDGVLGYHIDTSTGDIATNNLGSVFAAIYTPPAATPPATKTTSYKPKPTPTPTPTPAPDNSPNYLLYGSVALGAILLLGFMNKKL